MSLPANVAELARRLQAEGCLADSYALGAVDGASDAHCLVLRGDDWVVFYAERGLEQPPMFTSPVEAEATAYLYRLITSFRHDHCVGFFRSEAAAVALAERLSALGLQPHLDAIRYTSTEARHRVFVTGRAIFAARAALGSDLPVDEGS